jgi:hypothetical protein
MRGSANVATPDASIVDSEDVSGPGRAFFFVVTGSEADGEPVPAAGPADPADAVRDAEPEAAVADGTDTAPPWTVEELDALFDDDPVPDCPGELPAGLAQATPEPEMTAAPIPSAAANPPMRPM